MEGRCEFRGTQEQRFGPLTIICLCLLCRSSTKAVPLVILASQSLNSPSEPCLQPTCPSRSGTAWKMENV